MGINVENILRVADAIEQHSIPDLGFNMASYYDTADEWTPDLSGHRCGTAACIAGWAVAVRDGKLPAIGSEADRRMDYLAEATAFLGLPKINYNGGPAERLMLVINPDIGPSKAVAVLRHLAATGEVDWTISSPEAA